MTYFFCGTHAETLASGRPLAPGDEVPLDAVNNDDANDQRLIDEGLLVKQDKPARSSRGETKEQTK